MKNIDLRKTLNLHKHSINLQNLLSEWKIFVPLILSVSGIFIGTFVIRGESAIYESVSRLMQEYILNNLHDKFYISLLINLIFPSLFAVIMFFLGLSLYGGLIVNTLPVIYSITAGIVTYYMYSEYTLKGLAYCVIMIFPYVSLSLFSLILIAGECINMSQYLFCSLSLKRRKIPDYSINKYYLNTLKAYTFIISAAVIKTGLESLFIGLFRF